MGKRKTTDEFIADAIKKHGDKYDYTKVVYVKNKSKVIIICPEHKEFLQTPSDHLSGCGCPKCANKNITTDDFIEKSVFLYGEKYSYDESVYLNSTAPIKIFCKKCNTYFFRTYFQHIMNKKGCPCCAESNKWEDNSDYIILKTNEFIEASKSVHGNKYSYDRTVYSGVNNKMEIYCNECKKYFSITWHNHLRGRGGCKTCRYKNTPDKKLKKTNNFILKASQKHGEKYSYVNSNYINHKTNIEVHCNVCNLDFSILPSKHIKSDGGCPSCSETGSNKKLTTEEFISISIEKHKNKYSYEKSIYNGSDSMVEIFCKSCKEYFFQMAASHLSGCGCKKCGNKRIGEKLMMKKEDFIIKSKLLHGDQFNYDNIVYIHPNKEIEIYCNVCKSYFKQKPKLHLDRKTCPSCSDINKMSTKKFIEKSIFLHGDRYDYNMVNYINFKTNVKIFCKTCGEYFEQLPHSHLEGYGCKICGYVSGADKNRMTTNEFIKKAREVHGKLFNYDSVVYVRSADKVKIYCNTCHEFFMQTPNWHLDGHGCANCYGNRKKTTEEFIKQAKEKYGDKYDYSKVVYEGTDKPVIIICPEHKEFLQTPYNHLTTTGCQLCYNKLNINETKLYKALSVEFCDENLIQQKTPKWLGLQSIDIFFKDYNIGVEYHGRQHFEPVSKFGGANGFIINRERDVRKYNLCLENDCKLFYFTYKHYEIKDYPYYVYSDLNKLYLDIADEIELRKK